MTLYDQQLANNAQAVDQCMKLGAVIIKTTPKLGFTAPPAPPTLTKE